MRQFLLTLFGVVLIAILTSVAAHAACSPWRSSSKQAWFNEYFFGNGGSAPPNFLEIFSNSNAFPSSWQNWSIDVYTDTNSKITYPFNNRTATACTISGKTWLTTLVPGGLYQQKALVLLKDDAGAYVDAFVFDNTSPPDPWPGAASASWFPGLANGSTGCPALANALTSQAATSGTTPKQYNMLTLGNYGNKDMARDPDGGPVWDLTSNTGAGTTYTQCVSNNANFTKTVDNVTPPPGSTVTYTLNMSNTGGGSMSGVQITDYLPPTLIYLSSTSSNPLDPPVTTSTYATTDPNTNAPATATSVVWSPAPIAADTTSRLNIKMQVPANATVGYSYVNTAQTTGLSTNQTDFANITIGSPDTPSFAINVSPATSTTCTPALLGPKVTITAMSAANGGGNPLTSYNGTATLTASTPNPKWYDASGIPLPGNTVTFVNGTATLYLSDAVAETLTVSATDAAYASPEVMQGSSGNIMFSGSSTGLALTDADMLAPPYGAVAGRPHAVRASISSCGSASSTTGQYTGSIYYIPGLNHPVGAAAPTINTSAAACPGLVAPTLSSAGAPITLNFSGGQATFYLCTTDVGQYALSLTLNGVPSGTKTTTGTSSNFTVRPFVITATKFTKGTANPAGSGAFAAAGSMFTGKLSAWQWLPSADTETDSNGIARGNGLPDANVTAASIENGSPGPTLSFSGTTNNAGVVNLAPAVAPPVVTPADTTTYITGNLTPSTATLASGAATLNDAFSYSEVGNFRIAGAGGGAYAAQNYLGAAGVHIPILSDVIGRIIPDHFLVSSASLTHRPSCTPDSSFTYMGEPFTMGFTLTARNAAGTATQNYRDSYAFLDPATAQWTSLSTVTNGSFGLGAFDHGTDLSARLKWNSATGSGWSNGSNTIVANVQFDRSSAVDGPFEALALGVAPRDADGATVKASALDLNGDRMTIGSNKMRFGRLKLFSQTVAGPSTLNMPVQAQFWSGNSWILNSDDNCTMIPSTAVRAFNYRNYTSASVPAWPASVGGNVQINGGNSVISLSKPSSIRAGTVDICVDLGTDPAGGVACSATPVDMPFLQGRWAPGTSYANDPTARATFGIYTPETRRVVHIRELF
ncbi:MAG TPA: DUF6701 domain-containing protein [Noviherbaspirillum sp.]|uniref:DUF6701 domain-containing protein n=1 Tax=Noviherbaspirillum sp. TaxID=1926288 RepID=UPI002B479B82|nr:DUF6701 domain-containing protein [Noviherbaspirillum sp.]HJV84118.1 DUF6701 domain-containing protein [Noviherbaspirillum sp.]